MAKHLLLLLALFAAPLAAAADSTATGGQPFSFTETLANGPLAGRKMHAALALGKKMLIFWGDYSAFSLRSDAALYDTQTGQWESFALPVTAEDGPAPDYPAPRSDFKAVVFEHGDWDWEIRIYGGKLASGSPYGYTTAVVNQILVPKYSMQPHLQIRCAHLPESFVGLTGSSVVGYNNRDALIWGGINDGGVEFYGSLNWGNNDYDCMHWSTLMLPTPDASRNETFWDVGRAYHSAVIINQKMIVFGGVRGRENADPQADGEVYNFSTKSWTKLPSGPLRQRQGHTAVAFGSKMVVWGGFSGKGYALNEEQSKLLSDGAILDESTGEWRMMPPSPLSARAFHSAVVIDGKMFVWGGYDGAMKSDGAVFDISTNTWLP